MGLPTKSPSRGASNSTAARLANSMKPCSSTVTIAAGLVSTNAFSLAWVSKLRRRFLPAQGADLPGRPGLYRIGRRVKALFDLIRRRT